MDDSNGTPASTKVGTSGANCERVADAMAMIFTLPLAASSLTLGRPVNIMSTWPPIVSAMAGPAPLYGT